MAETFLWLPKAYHHYLGMLGDQGITDIRCSLLVDSESLSKAWIGSSVTCFMVSPLAENK
jgi:hypothetical protein